ncbi:MAG TPA: NAD(P)H-hydrate epimerase, partial [Flavisolibacter sp.]
MQILSAEQIRAWDRFTVQHEGISSIDLMERAAQKCAQWLLNCQWFDKKFLIFCGKGNNGGDGLAIARLLIQKGYNVSIYILESGKLGSDDFQLNLQRLQELPAADVHFVQSDANLPKIRNNDVVVDALFGSGLNKPLDGLSAALVNHINVSPATIISIDLPSGLFIDRSSLGNAIIKADYTLTFQCYKPGLLVQENAPFIGQVNVLDIGLLEDFLSVVQNNSLLLDEGMIRKIFRPRQRFAHKGTFGHSLVIGGSYGKMGAVVLATKACMGSGAGLTTALIPTCGYHILQSTAPEAMTLVDTEETHLTTLP